MAANTQSFNFTEGNANQDFTRQGIVAATPGETIASIELQNSGGFKEAKQFSFSLAPGVTGGVPEPAAWSLMLLGIGAIGAHVARFAPNPRSHSAGQS